MGKVARALGVFACAAGGLLAVGAASADAPALSVQNLEQIGTGNGFMAGPLFGFLGSRVDYQIIVTNDGDEAADVTLDDSSCSDVAPAGAQVVQPGGGYVVWTCSHTLSAADRGSWTNAATVNGMTVKAVTLVAVVGNVAGTHKVVHHKKKHKRHR